MLRTSLTFSHGAAVGLGGNFAHREGSRLEQGARQRRGAKFLMGQQARAAGCPGERGGGGQKIKKKHELGEEEERKQQPRRDKKSPKAASRFEEWGVFYGGIVKCALSFPFAGGNEGPHSI